MSCERYAETNEKRVKTNMIILATVCKRRWINMALNTITLFFLALKDWKMRIWLREWRNCCQGKGGAKKWKKTFRETLWLKAGTRKIWKLRFMRRVITFYQTFSGHETSISYSTCFSVRPRRYWAATDTCSMFHAQYIVKIPRAPYHNLSIE